MAAASRRAGARRGFLPILMGVLALPFLAIGIPIMGSVLAIQGVPAEVVQSGVGSMDWGPEAGSRVYVCEVVYAYEVNGVVHRGAVCDVNGALPMYETEASALAAAAEYPVGMALDAFYRSDTPAQTVTRAEFWVGFVFAAFLLLVAALWVMGAAIVLRFRARQHRAAAAERRAAFHGTPWIGRGRRDADVLLEAVRDPVPSTPAASKRHRRLVRRLGVAELSSSVHPVRVGEAFALRLTLTRRSRSSDAFELRVCRGSRQRRGMVAGESVLTVDGTFVPGEQLDCEWDCRIAADESPTRDQAEESVIWIVELTVAGVLYAQWELQVAPARADAVPPVEGAA